MVSINDFLTIFSQVLGLSSTQKMKTANYFQELFPRIGIQLDCLYMRLGSDKARVWQRTRCLFSNPVLLSGHCKYLHFGAFVAGANFEVVVHGSGLAGRHGSVRYVSIPRRRFRQGFAKNKLWEIKGSPHCRPLTRPAATTAVCCQMNFWKKKIQRHLMAIFLL